MDNYLEMLEESAGYIRKTCIGNPEAGMPEIAVILGSGLGSLADSLKNPVIMEYKNIPGFPAATVAGHAGRLVHGMLGGRSVLVMQGRIHHYEGHDMLQVVFPVRTMWLAGIKGIIVTNAAGGINRSFKPGDIMLIKDHIGLFAPSPLCGPNMDSLGVRFPDMSGAYSRRLVDLAYTSAASLHIDIKEGIYAYARGPQYETPAEVRALAALGADAVGMSTVPEVVAARHLGMEALGISCIANMAAGILDKPLCHEEVINAISEAGGRFADLIGKIVENWPDYK